MANLRAELMAYLLGIDAGNTVVKAVLFDPDGRILGHAARDGHAQHPAPGHVERDIDELWDSAAHVIRDCLRAAGCDSREVRAVGTAGHGNGLYLLDHDQRPLIGIQSLDARATALAASLRSNGTSDRLYPLCLQKPWPSQTATLLAWMKRHQPDLYARAGTALLCKDLLTLMLTGQRSTDYSDMSGCGLLRLPQRRYDSTLLEAYGLTDAETLLPPLIESDHVAGQVTPDAAAVTGLSEGTPVAAGFFDVIASMLGAGASKPGQAAIVAGTWSINQVILDSPLIDDCVFHASTWRPDRYVAIESSATSAVNLEWFVREFIGLDTPDPFGRCSEAVAAVMPDASLPIFHPFLYGSATQPHARGGFFGLSGWHAKAHMLYALYEGVAFEHRRHVDRLRAAGARFDRAALSGGGSRSDVWCQMFADIVGIPMEVPECPETGALGAAMAGGVAAGLFGDLEQAVRSMARIRRIYRPRTELRSLIEGRYRLYCDLIEAVSARWPSHEA
jgi:L-xylulokinase